MKKILALSLVFAAALFAADTVTENLTVQKTTKIASVTINVPPTGAPQVSIAREQVRVVNGEVIGRTSLGAIQRTVDEKVGAQTVKTSGGKSLSASEVQEAIVLFAAQWLAEDEAEAAADQKAEAARVAAQQNRLP